MNRPIEMPRKGGKWATFIEQAVAFPGPGCLIWPYAKDKHGYGVMEVRGHKNCFVHRLICKLSHGAPPDDATICAHLCGVPSCVAPHHLRWTTQQDNLDDKYRHGTINRGTRNGGAKMTEQDVLLIRQLHAEGMSCVQIAERFPVNSRSINRIVLRQKWAWL